MHSPLLSALAAVSFVSLVVAVPTPVQVDAPRQLASRSGSHGARVTPTYVAPPAPEILPFDDIASLLGAVTGYSADSELAQLAPSKRSFMEDVPLDFEKDKRSDCGVYGLPCSSESKRSATSSAASSSVSCLGNGYTEKQINSLFSMGGAGTTVKLCASSTINVANPIQFTASSQTLTTINNPTGSTRATIVVTGKGVNAITANCPFCNNLTLQSVQVNGNRPALGYISRDVDGTALIEMGGTSSGHTINNVHAYETRGWSCAHVIEGDNGSCSNAVVTNSQFGPCGNAPSAGQSQEKRATTIPPGQWADGLSLSCAASTVKNNVITDATDGGIVVFGSPGSTISGNTVIASTRQLMGGLNAVDVGGYNGNFTGTVFSNNVVSAQGAMIKIGMALGTLVWAAYDDPSFRTYGATFTNNKITSGSSTSGYFGFGVAAAGVNSTTVSGTTFSGANFGGKASSTCLSGYLPPTPGPLYWDPTTTDNQMQMQSGFNTGTWLVYLICEGPSTTLTKKGYSA